VYALVFLPKPHFIDVGRSFFSQIQKRGKHLCVLPCPAPTAALMLSGPGFFMDTGMLAGDEVKRFISLSPVVGPCAELGIGASVAQMII
jgi:hypothetical protein